MKPDQAERAAAAAIANAADAVQVTSLEHGVSSAGSPVALAASDGTRTVWRYGKRNRRAPLVVTVLCNAVALPLGYLLLRGTHDLVVAAMFGAFTLSGLVGILASVFYLCKKLVVVVDGDRVLAGSGVAVGDPMLKPICRAGDVRAVRLGVKGPFTPAVFQPSERERRAIARHVRVHATLVLHDGSELPLVDEIDGREAALALARSLAATMGLGRGAIELDARLTDEARGTGNESP